MIREKVDFLVSLSKNMFLFFLCLPFSSQKEKKGVGSREKGPLERQLWWEWERVGSYRLFCEGARSSESKTKQAALVTISNFPSHVCKNNNNDNKDIYDDNNNNVDDVKNDQDNDDDDIGENKEENNDGNCAENDQ